MVQLFYLIALGMNKVMLGYKKYVTQPTRLRCYIPTTKLGNLSMPVISRFLGIITYIERVLIPIF